MYFLTGFTDIAQPVISLWDFSCDRVTARGTKFHEISRKTFRLRIMHKC